MTGPKSSPFVRQKSVEVAPVFDAQFVGQFLKTKTCKFWQSGRCKRGESCTYAHGNQDVKEMPNLTKTSLCREFMSTGICANAECSFAHGMRELRATDNFFKTSMCSWFQAGQCHLGQDCRYAHDECELREKQAPALADAVPVVGKKQRSRNRAFDKTGIQETFEEIKWERTSTSPPTFGRTFPHEVQTPVARQGVDRASGLRHLHIPSCTSAGASHHLHHLVPCILVQQPHVLESATGSCANPECSFTHGMRELRATDNFFKTSMCCYFQAGHCHLGQDCRYAHDECELREKQAPALADAMPVVGEKQRSSNRTSDKSCIEETFEEIKWERTSTSPATLERTFSHDVQNPVALQPCFFVPWPVAQGIEASSPTGAYLFPNMEAELLKSAMPDVYED